MDGEGLPADEGNAQPNAKADVRRFYKTFSRGASILAELQTEFESKGYNCELALVGAGPDGVPIVNLSDHVRGYSEVVAAATSFGKVLLGIKAWKEGTEELKQARLVCKV